VEAARKALKKRAPKEGDHHVAAVAAGEAEARSGGLLGDAGGTAGGGGARGGTAGPSSCGAVTHEYYLMTEEVYRSRLQAIRAEELSVVKEKERLEVRGVGHAGMQDAQACMRTWSDAAHTPSCEENGARAVRWTATSCLAVAPLTHSLTQR
jgi:hypothetical protein